MFTNPGNAPLQLITDEEISTFGVKLYIKREDLIHPFVSGNKWRKLKYNFLEAEETGLKKIVTFGGAYSNHISAVAAAGSESGFETIGIIRGEEHLPLNPTLLLALENGMKLIYISRSRYKDFLKGQFLKELEDEFGRFYLIPEGGTNALAVKGTREITDEIDIKFNYICAPVGTGGTLAGLIASEKDYPFKVLGFSALKNADGLKPVISDLVGKSDEEWSLINDYSFGGYAKFNQGLIEFINRFKEYHNISLDPLYTGKMLYGIYDLIKNQYFPEESVVIAIHTGGLQGIAGFNERFGNIIK